MKRYYRNYKKRIKQKKYNEFKNSGQVIFSDKQMEKIKKQIEIENLWKRISKVNAIFTMTNGEYNAKRLSTYPCINNGIKSKGICAYCEIETDVIHFDDNVSLCENCATEKNLI